MKLEGKTAFITGGSRGIGGAIAKAYLAEGARIMLVAQSQAELEAMREELGGGRKVEVCALDVSEESQAQSAIKKTIEAFGSIEILVNAAGIYGPIGSSLEVDLDLWRRAFEVNVLGTFIMIRSAVPFMKTRGKGKVINFSGGGDGPLPNFSAYSASKVSVVRLTETLAEEFKLWNISVNAIAPGAVNTKFLEEALAAGEERVGSQRYRALLKQKKEGGVSPEKTAGLCVFLGSDASDGLTGKFLSAVWDAWPEWDAEKIREIMKSPAFTLRRVDPNRDV